MNPPRFTACGVLAILTCAYAASASAASDAMAPKPVSGLDLAYIDPAVRPQDDFYRYVNGRWLNRFRIPADKSSYGAFTKIADDTQKQLRALIEDVARQPGDDPDARKVAAFYQSFMDEATVDKLGVTPLQPILQRIDALKSKKQLAQMFSELQKIGVTVPFVAYVHQDAKDSSRYIIDFYQSGLGMPDRDYYLKPDNSFKHDRVAYRAHVATMLRLAGQPHTQAEAGAIVALETALAKVQWTRVQSRDADKTYNPTPIAKLTGLTPGYDWAAYLQAAGVHDVPFVVISQPSYFQGLSKVLRETPLATWKAYLKWHLISDYAPFLPKPFVDENFAFYGRTLQGTPELKARWKRAIETVDANIGFALGKLYVARYFPASSKARMQQLVANLRSAYADAFQHCDWMDAATRQRALDKLAKFTPKIGYPDKWRDYSALTVKPDDLVGNVMRAQAFEYARQIHKLGRPVDKTEWEMTPQTVNAYYNPEQNEIVFPAAILQPPFFNPQADDAVNYGGIGAVIGHEMSHGFDDQGAKYDGDGNLHNWWTPETLKRFQAKTRALIAQYDAYAPLPGHHVNGALTVGENIADNAGLAIAYQAYRLSLHGKPAPVIDGYTGAQRFLMGWAQVWRFKARRAEVLRRLTIDPHSPPQFRADGAVRNLDAFYSAFDVKPGDKMYLPPRQRVHLY